MKKVKKLASVALPIAAAFIPGVGPLVSAALVGGAGVLGSKIGGASWGDALKSGALSGLMAGAAPILGNAFSSFAPETAGALGIGGGYNTVFGKGFGALSGAPASAASTGALSSGTESFLRGLGAPETISPALSAADPSLVATGAARVAGDGGGALSSMLSKIQDNPFAALTVAQGVGNALSGPAAGTLSQEQILAKQQADAAAQEQFSRDTVKMLDAASSGRAPVAPSIADYYTYGQRPEALFYDNVNPRTNYGSGALS
jgi:hypothetical protein